MNHSQMRRASSPFLAVQWVPEAPQRTNKATKEAQDGPRRCQGGFQNEPKEHPKVQKLFSWLRHIPTSPQMNRYQIMFVGGINASHVSAETATNPTKKRKTEQKLPVIMRYVCSKKCKMLTLTFLKDSYVTCEQRRLQITKFQALGGLLGTFGEHFGSILEKNAVFKGLLRNMGAKKAPNPQISSFWRPLG